MNVRARFQPFVIHASRYIRCEIKRLGWKGLLAAGSVDFSTDSRRAGNNPVFACSTSNYVQSIQRESHGGFRSLAKLPI